MESIIGLVCTLVALVGLLVALGHDGYLMALRSVANKRVGGEPVARFVRGRWPAALIATVGTLLGLLITFGSSLPADIIGLLIAGGSGIAAAKSLQATRKRFLGGPGHPELPS